MAFRLIFTILGLASVVCSATYVQAQDLEKLPQGTNWGELIANLLETPQVTSVDAPIPPDITEPVHLDESVAFALGYNFEVKASEATREATRYDAYTSMTQYMPTYSVVLDKGKNFSAPSVVTDTVTNNKVSDLTHHLADRTYTLHQPLADMSIIADMLGKRTTESASAESLRSTRERIAFQTVSAFYQMLQAMILIKAAQEYETAYDQLYDRMKARVEGGGSSGAELDRIKSRQVNAKSAVLAAKSNYAAALYDYKRLTGVVPQTLVVPSAEDDEIVETEQQLIEQALQYNPDITSLRKQAEAQGYEVDRLVAKYLPTLSFDYSNSVSNNVDGAADANPSLGNYFPQQQEKKWMMTLNWQLSGGYAPQAAAAYYRKKALEQQMYDAIYKTQEAVRLAMNGYQSAAARIPQVKQSIEALRSTTSTFEVQFRLGNRPLLDLLDTYERLYQSRLDLAQLAVSQGLAYYQIKQTTGHLVDALHVPPEPVER